MLSETTRANEDASASDIANEILIWLSGKPDLMKRFLEMSGIQADEIRGQIGKPSFSAGLIGFIMNHEPDLLDFSYERSIPAERVQHCYERISNL